MSKSCLECYYRRLSRDSPHCAACDASGSGFSFDALDEHKSTYGLCLQCGTYHVSGEKCPVIYRIEPKLEKPVDFNFYWEILSSWVLDFKPRVSVHQLRGLCERLTTITASNIGIDPIEALHCGKTPNNCFNLTQRSSVSQVKQMLDGRQSGVTTSFITPTGADLRRGEIMENWRIEFPDVSDVDVAFGRYPSGWFTEILKIESQTDDRKWNDLAESLFFQGGEIPFNKSLPEAYLIKGSRILKAVLGSWEPKHEDKEKVCGLILKSICA